MNIYLNPCQVSGTYSGIHRRVIMKITVIKENNIEIAIVNSNEILIKDVQSALDFMATINYETGCNRIIINKSAICEDFLT